MKFPHKIPQAKTLPAGSDIQQYLPDESLEDTRGSLDAALVYTCPKILTDNTTLVLDSINDWIDSEEWDDEADWVEDTVTVTEVNGGSDTTGVTLTALTISFDFSELPEERIWQIKLSNGSEYHLLGSTRVFDISGNDNHATLSGTLDTDYEISQQSEFDPYSSYGFNKAWRGVSAQSYLVVPLGEDFSEIEFIASVDNSISGFSQLGFSANDSANLTDTISFSLQYAAGSGYNIRLFDGVTIKAQTGYTITDDTYKIKLTKSGDSYGLYYANISSSSWVTVQEGVSTSSYATNFIKLRLYANHYAYKIKLTDTDGNIRYLEPSNLDWSVESGSFEIIDIPEDRSNAGYDVLGAETVYEQDGNTVLNAEGCQIEFDPEDSEDSKLDIFDRDNDTYHDLDVSQNGDYDSAYPYRWSVWELFNSNDFVTYNREYKLRAFNQTVENGFPIGIRRIVNYDDQRLDGTDADTTTINRLSNCLNTLSIADQATMYDSKLYIDTAVRPSILNQDGLMADVGYVGDELVTNGDFSDGDTDWTLINWRIIDGAAHVDGVANDDLIQEDILTVGKKYLLKYDVVENFTTLTWRLTSASSTDLNKNIGTHSLIFTASARRLFFRSQGAGAGAIDNIYVKEIGDTVGEVVSLGG